MLLICLSLSLCVFFAMFFANSAVKSTPVWLSGTDLPGTGIGDLADQADSVNLKTAPVCQTEGDWAGARRNHHPDALTQ